MSEKLYIMHCNNFMIPSLEIIVPEKQTEHSYWIGGLRMSKDAKGCLVFYENELDLCMKTFYAFRKRIEDMIIASNERMELIRNTILDEMVRIKDKEHENV